MRLDNYNDLNATRSLNYSEKTPAVIIKTGDDTKADSVFGVFIPRLMYGLPVSKGAYEKNISLDTSKILNSKNKSIGLKKVKVKNYMNLPVAIIPNASTPKFTYGENVFVDMADRDLKSMFILPYSLGEVKRRKTDMFTIMCPNFKKPGEDLNPDNTYGLQIDTLNQIIGLWTSKNNGEKSKYTFGIDTKEGKVLLSDNGKRKIEIITDDDKIIMSNEKKSKIEIVGNSINIECETLNVKVKNDINIKSSSMNRDIDKIKTKANADTEEIKKLDIKGNVFNGKYNKQTWQGASYSNKTMKYIVNSPISGFSGTLTSNDFSISPAAGMIPPPTCANINAAGMAAFGMPSLASLPLVRFPTLLTALTQITTIVDILGSLILIPPTLTQTVTQMAPTMMSPFVRG